MARMRRKIREALLRRQKRRGSMLRSQLRSGLRVALSNADGFARLLAISDDEWQEARARETDEK